MKKIALTAICLVLALVMVACQVAPTTTVEPAPVVTEDTTVAEPTGPIDEPATVIPETELGNIQKAGKIIMLTEPGFIPYEFIGDNGEVVGVDVEVGKAIAEKLGVELVVEIMDFDALITGLTAGKGNFIAAGMTVKEERKLLVDFTSQYAKSSQFIIVKKGTTGLTTLESLDGKSVGVQEGTTGHFLLEDDCPGAKIEPYKSILQASVALAAGKIDAVVIDRLPAQMIVSNNTALELMPAQIGDDEFYAIAVNKNSDLTEFINGVLDELIMNGKIDEWTIEYSSVVQ